MYKLMLKLQNIVVYIFISKNFLLIKQIQILNDLFRELL